MTNEVLNLLAKEILEEKQKYHTEEQKQENKKENTDEKKQTRSQKPERNN